MVGYDKMKEFCAHESKKNSWDWRLQWLSIISAFVSNSGRHADGKHCNCSLSRIDACLLSVSIEPMSYENGTKRSSGSIFVWWCLMVFRDFGAKAVSSLFSFEGIYIYIYICEAYKNRNCPRSTRPGWNPVWEKLFGECFCHCQRLYCMMMIIMITAKKCSILSLFFLLSFHMPQLQLESDAQCLI